MNVSRLLPVITAATPGGFKVASVAFATVVLATPEAAIFTSGYSFASALILLCGVGFSTILVKELGFAKFPGSTFFQFFITAAFIGGGASFLICYMASLLIDEMDARVVAVLSISMVLYQVSRNFLIAQKKFLELLLYDSFWLFLVLLQIFIFCFFDFAFTSISVGLFYSSAYFVVALACFFRYAERPDNSSCGEIKIIADRRDVLSSIIVGASNIASGGVAFLLPVLFLMLGNDDIIIISSLSAVFFNAIAVFPRGVVNNNLKEISLMAAGEKVKERLVPDLKRKVFLSLLVVSAPTLIALYLYIIIFLDLKNYMASFVFLCLLLFNVLASQVSVVEATFMNFLGFEKYAMFVNFLIFSIAASLFLLGNLLSSGWEVYLAYGLPFVLGVMNLIRMKLYSCKVSKIL